MFHCTKHLFLYFIQLQQQLDAFVHIRNFLEISCFITPMSLASGFFLFFIITRESSMLHNGSGAGLLCVILLYVYCSFLNIAIPVYCDTPKIILNTL